MGNTPTAKKGNEMESGEYPRPVVELEELSCHVFIGYFCCICFLFSMIPNKKYSSAPLYCARPPTLSTLTYCFWYSSLRENILNSDVHGHSHLHQNLSKLFYCDAMFISAKHQRMLFMLFSDYVGKLVIKSPRLYSEVSVRMTTSFFIQKS